MVKESGKESKDWPGRVVCVGREYEGGGCTDPKVLKPEKIDEGLAPVTGAGGSELSAMPVAR